MNSHSDCYGVERQAAKTVARPPAARPPARPPCPHSFLAHT